MLVQWGWFALGAALLVLGADSLVKGAVGITLAARVRPFLAGFVVLGFGSALPELAVNLEAVRSGHPGIALGNVVGSNIANFGLVLGLAAVLAPFATGLRMSAVLLPLFVAVTLVLGLLGADTLLTRVDAGLLLILFVATLVLVIQRASREPEAVQRTFAEASATRPGTGMAIARVVIGAGVMGYGAYLAVGAAALLAQAWALCCRSFARQ